MSLNMNWASTSFTASGGSATNITKVTSVSIDPNGSVKKFSGDGDRYSTTVVGDFIDTMITVESAHIAVLSALVPGTYGAFATTLKDSKRRTTGDIAFALATPTAMIQNVPFSGKHRDFASGRVLICTESTDGTTNPLTATIDATP